MIITDIIGFFTGRAELYADENNSYALVKAIAELGINANVSADSENGGVNVTVSPSNAKKIASALDKSGNIVYINNVCGIKSICINNIKRIGLLIGALLFFALLSFSTLFVFKVEVVGSDTVSKEQIKSELADLGIRVGARLSDIDRAAAATSFMKLHPEYSWAAVNFKGTTVCLELKERESGESAETENVDILIADLDGVIKEVLVYSGKSAVKPGDVVKKGDILISGFISGNGLQYSDNPMLRFDGAAGSVKAEVEDSFLLEVKLEEEICVSSVGEKTGTVFSFMGSTVKLGEVIEDSSEYVMSASKSITVLGCVELPITYRECFRNSTETKTVTYDSAQAEAEAVIRAYSMLHERLGEAELTEIEMTKEITESGVTVTVVYGCVREIAVPKKQMINGKG